jgi:hypothetical protein
MKIILPLAATTMLVFATLPGVVSAATTPGAAAAPTGAAQTTNATSHATTIQAPHVEPKAACNKKADEQKLTGTARHDFVRQCVTEMKAPAASKAK